MKTCISGWKQEDKDMAKKRKRQQKRLRKRLLLLIIILGILGGGYTYFVDREFPDKALGAAETCIGKLEQIVAELTGDEGAGRISLDDIPEYSGQPYVVIDGNVPDFTEEDKTGESFESYSKLDFLGRCGSAFANIGTDLMPDGEREDISQIYPSGWENHEYDFIDGGYVYNRCHLIGFQLAGENANERNLITGTRYMNVEGMLPFENQVAEYVRETGNHVLYRVTPIYKGTDLVASGVQMEAWSVEDEGQSVQFNVYCYNVQPGVVIDYSDGENWIAE